jgi:HK97 family phage major capsid protein
MEQHQYSTAVLQSHLAKAIQTLSRGRITSEYLSIAENTWRVGPVVEYFKTATNPLTTTSGSALRVSQLNTALVALLAQQSALEKLRPKMTRVPFQAFAILENVAPVGVFVGETESTPLTSPQLSSSLMDYTKLSLIAVLTRELLRIGGPAAEESVLTTLRNALSLAQDTAFLSTTPSTATIRPAGIGNGSLVVTSTGSSAAQIATDIGNMVSALASSWISPAWIMHPKTLAFLNTRNDAGLLTNLSDGPVLCGIPIITTLVAGSIWLIDAADILIAFDDQEMELDRSEQSALVFTDSPQSSPAATSLVSLWERNYVAFKVTRPVNWLRAHTTSVVRMSVSY